MNSLSNEINNYIFFNELLSKGNLYTHDNYMYTRNILLQ